MATVSLKGMRFYAYHGYYEFERKIGNNFIVDVDIITSINRNPNEFIESTVNYEEIYVVVNRFMLRKYRLLETLAFEIATEIKGMDSKVESVKVSLSKLAPPVGGKVDRAVVTIEL